MKIKFIKKHPVGIAKDEVRNLQESQAEKMIVEGYAEEISEQEYEEAKKEMIKVAQVNQSKIDSEYKKKKDKEDKEAKKRFEATEKTGISTVKKEKKETPKDDRVFHKVTIGDLDNNPDFKIRHVKEGDEILLGDDGNPIRSSDDGSYYGREGKIVGKLQTPSKDSTKDGEDGSGSVENTGENKKED